MPTLDSHLSIIGLIQLTSQEIVTSPPAFAKLPTAMLK
jgi:hypothetical protein